MQELDLALEMLHAILDDKVSFSEALRRRFQSDLAVREMRSNVAGIVGCELRHHLLFSYILKNKVADDDKKRLIGLALSNHYFFRRFDEEAVLADLKAVLTEEELALYQELASKDRGVESLIGQNIRHASNLYLSLRFNTPEWVLKIFQHFGYGQTYKIIRSYARPRQNIVRILPKKISMEEVCKDGEFAPNAAYPDIFADHTGKTSLRKFPFCRNGNAFDMKLFGHKVLMDHLVEAPSQILLYNGNENSALERDLIAIYGDSIGLNIACPDTTKRPEVTRLIRDHGKVKLSNVNFFSAPNGDGFKSQVSCKQDLVILAPLSTNFDDIPTSPDFLLRFNKEGMDQILQGEKKLLENAAEQVEEGGKLIYMIYTISKKEGDRMITDFLAEHPEFTAIEKRQYFPFEEESFHTGVFYAELQKGKTPLTIPAPVLAAEQAKISSGQIASAKGE